jgi:hypothetical protein
MLVTVLMKTAPLEKNMAKQVEQVYQSFLIRCWLIPPAMANEPPAWRFELREVTAESPVQRFGSLAQLHEFLAVRLTAVAANNNHEREKEED